MLDKNEILKKAYIECLTEMYEKAQPSVDFQQLMKDAEDGKIGKDELVYERYYLSSEEFKYILDKYVNAYRLEDQWITNIELLETYLKEGGLEDIYVEKHTDEKGIQHGGYRSAKEVKSLEKQFIKLFEEQFSGMSSDEYKFMKKLLNCVYDNIDKCKKFYKFDQAKSSFCASIALGPSPTSNKDTVIEYWKQQGVDINIEERNPQLFWEKDYYGDEFNESDYE